MTRLKRRIEQVKNNLLPDNETTEERRERIGIILNLAAIKGGKGKKKKTGVHDVKVPKKEKHLMKYWNYYGVNFHHPKGVALECCRDESRFWDDYEGAEEIWNKFIMDVTEECRRIKEDLIFYFPEFEERIIWIHDRYLDDIKSRSPLPLLHFMAYSEQY